MKNWKWKEKKEEKKNSIDIHEMCISALLQRSGNEENKNATKKKEEICNMELMWYL